MDRFQFIDKPPKIVGECSVCQDEIELGYDKKCKCCNNMICRDCERECWICKQKQCKHCMCDKKDANGEYICTLCFDKRVKLNDKVVRGINIPDYWYVGMAETDEEVILEYISSKHPKIQVCIEKMREPEK